MEKKRALALSLALAAAMLLPTDMMAQKGLFGTQSPIGGKENPSLLGKGNNRSDSGMDWSGDMTLQDPTQPRPVGVGTQIFGDGFDWSGGGMTAQDPTEEAPLGSGLLILAMAGVGYAIVVSRKVKSRK